MKIKDDKYSDNELENISIVTSNFSVTVHFV